jgi:hypothetical protein
MANYHVKNGSHVDKAFKVYGGFDIVKAGQEGDVETIDPLTEAQIDAFARDRVKVVDAGGAAAFADLTVAELKVIAEDEAIDLGDATKKADIIAAIELAREAKA